MHKKYPNHYVFSHTKCYVLKLFWVKQNYLLSRVFTGGDSTTVPDAFHTILIDPFISVQLNNHFDTESSESIFCAFLIKCRHKHVEVINSHTSHISSMLNILFQPLSSVSCWKTFNLKCCFSSYLQRLHSVLMSCTFFEKHENRWYSLRKKANLQISIHAFTYPKSMFSYHRDSMSGKVNTSNIHTDISKQGITTECGYEKTALNTSLRTLKTCTKKKSFTSPFLLDPWLQYHLPSPLS